MAKNSRYAWTESYELPVPAGTESGDPVKVGELVGVALTTRDGSPNAGIGNKDGHATVALDGVWDLEVTGALAGAGTPVYIAVNGSLTATVGENTLFGHTVPGVTDGSKGSGAGVVSVRVTNG